MPSQHNPHDGKPMALILRSALSNTLSLRKFLNMSLDECQTAKITLCQLQLHYTGSNWLNKRKPQPERRGELLLVWN